MNSKDKERIMIVDDDVNVGRSLALIFGKKGYETETAHTGQEALDIAKGKSFNIALLDINLPDMQGIELIAPLKEMHPDMAVIMVTGHASMENAVRALNEGAEAYNTKPLNMDEVLATVENVVDKQHLIFEKQQAEEALRESENRFKDISYSMADWIWEVDKNGKYIFASGKVKSILGYAPEELIGKTPFDLMPKDEAKKIGEIFKEIAAKKKPIIDIENWNLTKDGNRICLLTNGVPIKDEEGHLQGYRGVDKDITERKQAEEERKRLNRNLTEKNKELEQIVYATSHDLRSPLVNVQGFSKELDTSLNNLTFIIKDEKVPLEIREKVMSILDDDISESLQYILTSVSKMDSLLNGLLKLSRLDRTEFKKEKLNMNRMISDIIKTLEFKIKEANINLEVYELPPCKGDETQINQVFSNLLDNALKYLNSKRPGSIKISGDKKKGQVVYCVEDNGIGITRENQDKIFNIFHQLDPEKSAGEGLGLTIIRKILDKHNGKIWVESKPNSGSNFYVSLPSG